MKVSLLLVFLFLGSLLEGQQLSVKSFRKLENDLSARVANRMDQNGDVCAVIKVVSPEKGFFFDGDGNGIVSIEKKIGEYWIYLPYGSRFLTVKHERLGILRAYPYPERIDKACVYEMVLTAEDGAGVSEPFQCGGLLVDRRDGQKYRTRLLADGRCWMIENLRFGKCSGADFETYSENSVQNRLAPGYWGVCIASPVKGAGNLYNWQAAMNSESAVYNTSGNPSGNVDDNSLKQWQGICPEGWHLPSGGSSGEFQKLYKALSDASKFYPGNSADGWLGVFGGMAGGNSVDTAGSYGIYWSSTYYDAGNAYGLFFGDALEEFGSNNIYVYYANAQYFAYKNLGFAVRCVRDY